MLICHKITFYEQEPFDFCSNLNFPELMTKIDFFHIIIKIFLHSYTRNTVKIGIKLLLFYYFHRNFQIISHFAYVLYKNITFLRISIYQGNIENCFLY